MIKFKYLEPGNLEEVFRLLSKYKDEAKIIAGGQSLLPMLKMRLLNPKYIINIKGLKNLEYLKEVSGGIRIGALTTHRATELSPLVKQRFPILTEMEKQLASVQIRNWGTIGGALSHADPAGDLAPCLIALGAKLEVRSSEGTREVPMSDFFTDYLETILKPEEVVTAVEMPNPASSTGQAFVKQSVTMGSIAIVSVAVLLSLNSGKVKESRIVLGAVGPTPIIAEKAAKALVEKKPEDVLEEIATIAAGEAKPSADIHGSVELKRHLIKVSTKAALKKALERAALS